MDIFGSSVTSITQSFIGMIIMSPRLSKVVAFPNSMTTEDCVATFTSLVRARD